MEVFLAGLPLDLTDKQLKQNLAPHIAAINLAEWACQKQRKKNFGTITFQHVHDGERFLRQYGELGTGLVNHRGKEYMQARLTIMKTLIHCRRSNREPDPFMLRSLKKDVQDLKANEELPDAPIHLSVDFVATQLVCGYYDYDQAAQLEFVPEVEWITNAGSAKFLRDRLIVTYCSASSNSYRAEFPYRIIQAILTSTNPPSLTLTLWEPPRIFEVDTQPVGDFIEAFRVLQFFQGNSSDAPKPITHRLVALPDGSRTHEDVIGQCLVYQIRVRPEDFNYKIQNLHDIDLPITSHNLPRRSLSNSSFAEGMRAFHGTIQDLVTLLTFDILFQVQGLVQNGYLLPWTGKNLLVRLFQDSQESKAGTHSDRSNGTRKKHAITGLAIKKLFSQIPFPAPEIPASEFGVDEIIRYLEDNQSNLRLGFSKELISEQARNNLTMIYKVLVTPTTMSLHGPEPEAKNRILRKFETNTEYFVRIQFCDEDGQDIHFSAKVSNELVYTRFKEFLNKGPQIGGKKYNFLGFSHSSLRSHSAWFMAPFVSNGELNTYFSVIGTLGNFGTIFSPARCAARIGQAFSETPFALSLKDYGVKHYLIEDIRSRDGQRIFTDGVGWISQDVVDAILAALPQKKDATCFQIRWGGAKGMLALDARQQGSFIAVRPSMVKFESTDLANLEICDIASKPIPLVLNRQMIKILEDMAVPDEWFFQEQNKELSRLRRITATTFNTAAFLKRQKIAEKLGLARLIRRLDQLDIDYKHDRFLCSIVEAVILRELRLLKHKARIPIEEGVTLFGIVDETEFLREGEVFIAFDKTNLVETSYSSLDGSEMIVTRSPALHPGDIQLTTNRVPPDGHPLRRLKNCIVFSQKGDRDLPSQLSGGDLDGDIYNVIWDQYAVSNCQRVFPPADYSLVNPRVLDREVTREDMTSFFVEFMKTDNLGLIATRHMILADQRAAGTIDKDCCLLAQLHSTSVDYSKTGVPVDPNALRTIRSNRFRPDFMAPAPPTHLKRGTDIEFDAPTKPSADADDEEEYSGPKYRYYQTEKILGRLYRAIDERRIWNESVHIDRRGIDELKVWKTFFKHVSKQCEEKLGHVDWGQCTAEAWSIRHSYEDAITSACIDYSEHAAISITELEVFTGNIFNKSGIQTRKQRDRSLQLKDEFDRIAAWIEALIRRRPVAGIAAQNDEDDSLDESTINDDTMSTPLELSIACLRVGCDTDRSRKTATGGRNSKDDHLSFKVVAACCVIKELDLAIKKAEIKVGANPVDQPGTTGTTASVRLNGPGLA